MASSNKPVLVRNKTATTTTKNKINVLCKQPVEHREHGVKTYALCLFVYKAHEAIEKQN